LLNKKHRPPSECKYQIIPAIFLVFIDPGEDSVMANDDVMPLNLPVVLIEEEKLKEPLFDTNVFKQPRDEKLFQNVVHTRVNCSMWDHDHLLTHKF